MLLIDLWLPSLHAVLNPTAALQISNVRELDTDGSGIDAPGFPRKFIVNLQLRMRLRLEEPQRIEIGFTISPTPERIEHTLPLGVRSAELATGFRRSFGQSAHRFTTSIKDEAVCLLDSRLS